MITIISGNKKSIIDILDNAGNYDVDIQVLSSTSAQPYIGVNFVDGRPIGGRTMTEAEVKKLLDISARQGFDVEGDLEET